MTGIFINYRTKDAREAAPLLYDHLVRIFGRDQVFLDSAELPPGEPFDPELRRRLELSTVLLVLIGPDWLTLTDENGERLVDRQGDADSPGDYVRWEIESFMSRKNPAIPILLDDTPFPLRSELPASIRGLVGNQNLELHTRRHDRDLAEIVKVLERHVPRTDRQAAPSVGGEPTTAAATQSFHTTSTKGPVANGNHASAFGLYVEGRDDGRR